MNSPFNAIKKVILENIAPNFSHFWSTKTPVVWILAVIIGFIVALGAILFRELISISQFIWVGEKSEIFLDKLIALPMWVRVAVPTLGGLLVGYLITKFAPNERPEGVADVMAARAMGKVYISPKRGFVNIIAAAISLGTGGSAGREGPIVHFGASIASIFSKYIAIPSSQSRVLFGAGVAAAVTASFNAPIAGVLFALEVILGHYAVSAFVPIVISSVIATLVSRFYFGNYPGFIIPDYSIVSYWEFPAFALLGLTAAFVAIGFQSSIKIADKFAKSIKMDNLYRPAIGGFLIGVMSLFIPEILGIGYEVTNKALQGDYTLGILIIFMVGKSVMVAISLASRLVGGVFSPSLYVGAMAGGAFGIIASSFFPHLASDNGVYAIIGMGSVAAAVLGAPISTVLIVFELTGDYHITLALLLAVSIATGLSQAIQGPSIFHWQLKNSGIVLHKGNHRQIAKNVCIRDIIERCDKHSVSDIVQEDGDIIAPFVLDHHTLDDALGKFAGFKECKKLIVVEVDDEGEENVVGYITHNRALQIYNRALIASDMEEHQ